MSKIDYFGSELDLEEFDRSIANLRLNMDEGGQSHTNEIYRIQYLLVALKTITYGSSWRKRGFSGAIHNLFRKIDRLENIVQRIEDVGLANLKDTENETIIDTLGDLMNYSALVMGLVMQEKPNMKNKYLDELESLRDDVM